MRKKARTVREHAYDERKKKKRTKKQQAGHDRMVKSLDKSFPRDREGKRRTLAQRLAKDGALRVKIGDSKADDFY